MKENRNINQDLWERFLIKNHYNGYVYKYGAKVGIFHTIHGVIKFI